MELKDGQGTALPHKAWDGGHPNGAEAVLRVLQPGSGGGAPVSPKEGCTFLLKSQFC